MPDQMDQEEPQFNMMVSAKLRNMIALGAAFSLKPDGLSTLMSLKDRLRYTRLKFQRYLQSWWNFDSNPFSKIPTELKISSYPQSYQHYDSVPLMIAKYLCKRHMRGPVEDVQEAQDVKFSEAISTLQRKSTIFKAPDMVKSADGRSLEEAKN